MKQKSKYLRELEIEYNIFLIFAIFLMIFIIGLISYIQIQEFSDDLKKCHDAGYEGIDWSSHYTFNWDCYKYKEDGEKIISHQPLD